MTAKPNAKAHAFPFQIGLQTQEFIHAALFYAAIGDIAAGEYFKSAGAVNHLEGMLVNLGLAEAALEDGWTDLKKYLAVFKGTVYQNALITFNSHWDWYIRNLQGFVKMARVRVASPQLTSSQAKDFDRLTFAPMSQQLSLLEAACGVQFNLRQDEIEHLKEMSLVRNLGLHNRWEIDEHYLHSTRTGPWSVGDLRTVGIEGLRAWHATLLRVIHSTCTAVAIKYKDAPDYP